MFLLALVLGACSGPVVLHQRPGLTAVYSEGRFTIEWGTAQTREGKPVIAGYITNTRGSGVTNLRVQAQALDAEGQVIDTGTVLQPGYLGGFGRTYFEVPLEKSGPGYRVNVLGWDSARSEE